MRSLKRLVVWLIEVLVEGLLLGCLLGALVSSQIGVLNGMLGSVLAVPVVLFLNGYYLTRALAGVAWMSQKPWLYPVTAAVVFVAHVHYVVARSRSDLTLFAQAKELPFLIGGACIVFACALGGNWLTQKWTHAGNNGPQSLHRGIAPGSAGG
jgi:hypothetical protein